MTAVRRWFARRKARRLYASGRSMEAVRVLQAAYGKAYMDCLQVIAEGVAQAPMTIIRRGVANQQKPPERR